MVTLAMPHNYDIRIFGSQGSYQRHCAAWSWDDAVQMPGSSPLLQIAPRGYTLDMASNFLNHAWESWLAGNVEQALSEYAIHLGFLAAADLWWETSRRDPRANNYYTSGLGHSDLHNDYVWNALPPHCKTQ